MKNTVFAALLLVSVTATAERPVLCKTGVCEAGSVKPGAPVSPVLPKDHKADCVTGKCSNALVAGEPGVIRVVQETRPTGGSEPTKAELIADLNRVLRVYEEAGARLNGSIEEDAGYLGTTGLINLIDALRAHEKDYIRTIKEIQKTCPVSITVTNHWKIRNQDNSGKPQCRFFLNASRFSGGKSSWGGTIKRQLDLVEELAKQKALGMIDISNLGEKFYTDLSDDAFRSFLKSVAGLRESADKINWDGKHKSPERSAKLELWDEAPKVNGMTEAVDNLTFDKSGKGTRFVYRVGLMKLGMPGVQAFIKGNLGHFTIDEAIR